MYLKYVSIRSFFLPFKVARSGAVVVAYSPAIQTPSSDPRKPNHHEDLQGYHHRRRDVRRHLQNEANRRRDLRGLRQAHHPPGR